MKEYRISKSSVLIVVLMAMAFAMLTFMTTAKAEYIVIEFKVGINTDTLTAEEKTLLIEFQTLMAKIQPSMKNVVSKDGKVTENTTKVHICKHDNEGICVEEKSIEDFDFTKLTIPTPKPTP